MKGSSSARLPKINSGYLVAKQQVNPSVNKKKEKQKTNAKKCKKTRPGSLSKGHQVSSGQGRTRSGKEKPSTNKDTEVTKLEKIPPISNVTKQQGQIRMHEAYAVESSKLYSVESTTSIEKRRLVEAKSRDRLLSLLPTQETMDEMLMKEELFLSAKQEIDRLKKRFENNRTMIRDEISQQRSNSLLQQAKKAARINHSILGSRDRFNNASRDCANNGPRDCTNNCDGTISGFSSNEFDFVFGGRQNRVLPTLRSFGYWIPHQATPTVDQAETVNVETGSNYTTETSPEVDVSDTE